MKLDTYMTKHSLTDAGMASKVGVSVQAIHRYRSGQRIPRSEIMRRIMEVTNGEVQANDFFGLVVAHIPEAA